MRKKEMNKITMTLNVDHLIKEALQEDISSEDVTTNAVMKEAVTGEVQLICKQDGVVAGLDVFHRVFEILDENVKTDFYCKDGDEVKKGELMGIITGDIRALLSGERVALNYLQRMSGIATYTHSVAMLLEGTKTKLLDTRKTTPNMRIFEKYAVRVGGGYNHRYNLSDGVLLKDNHIGAAGSVAKAVEMAKMMDVPVLGLVENMSYVLCPDCGKHIDIFGEGKTDAVAAEFGFDLLARIPLDARLAALCDKGALELMENDYINAAADKVESL